MIDPAVWAALTEGIPLPDTGQRVTLRLRGGDVVTGTVTLLWLAMDTPAITVAAYGGQVTAMPELGDAWSGVIVAESVRSTVNSIWLLQLVILALVAWLVIAFLTRGGD